MRVYLIVTILIVSVTNAYTQACCCTGAGSDYSILPNIDKHIVGMRYSYSNYSTTTYPNMNMNMDGMDMSMMGAGEKGTETMHTLDIFGRFNIYKGLQVSAFLPVDFLIGNTSGNIQRTAGIGDASLLFQYSLLNPKKCNGKIGKHQLRLGAGIKLPSGKFSMTPDGMFSTDLQLGTGSVDFLANAIYTYRYKKFGFNLLASYKANTTNPQQFKFGDKLKGGANVFYIFSLTKDLQLMPTAGVTFEHDFLNVQKKEKLTYTGGEYLNASAGFDIYYKQLAFSFSVSPVLMSVSNWEGEPYPRLSFETGLYYSFQIISKHSKSKQNEQQKSI